MKKSLLKNNIKTITKTRRRFLSILVMAFLGVGFFSGLVASSPDMLDSLDKYVDSSNLYDINIISTLGLTDEDITAIQEIDGVEQAYGIQTKDSFVMFNEKESICKVIEYNENINTPVLISGRMPENSNECLLDDGYVLNGEAEQYIGKTIVLENEDLDEDDNPIFTKKEFTIVGIAESPLYISNERGTTTVGNGTVSFYIYCKDDVINLDYYTEIGVKVAGAKEEVTNSNGYLELVNPVYKKIEEIKQTREQARYDSLVNEANQKIDDAQKEFDEKKAEADSELQEAENKINDAKNEINEQEKTLNNSKAELNKQEKNLDKQFQDAENQIKEAEQQINDKSTELENGKKELESKRAQANEAIAQIDSGITTAQNTLTQLESQKQQLVQAGMDTTQIDAGIAQAQGTIEQLKNQKTEAQNQLKSAEDQITSGEKELENAKTRIQNQKSELEKNKKTAYKKISDGRAEIEDGKQQIQEAKQEIEKNEQEFQEKKAEAEQELNDAQAKIDEARQDVTKIEKAKWYIQDRFDNTGYSNIFDAIQTISNISKMFPVIFYLVAVLISLTSMTRMIDEERTEIGTLKALGYTNIQIISKYILYAFLACVIGGILGMTVCFYLLPTIVWKLYSMIYTIPEFYITYRLDIGLAGIVIAFICIGGATILSAYKELRETPAVLMRPKAPKNGKRILMEKITFIWKKLNFSQKVTVRNIFRYKKRAIITIIGIAGCTGLMLAGFGIRDSVSDIPDFQFKDLFKYETSITLSNTDGLEEIKKYLTENTDIENFHEVCASTAKISNDELSYDLNIFVPNSTENFGEVINLVDSKTGEKLQLSNNGVIVTDKLADKFEINIGDEITIIDSDDVEYTLKVEGITQNYVSHYIYMSKEYYEANMNNSYKTNMILLNTKDITQEQQNTISEALLNYDGVASVSIISTLIKSVSDMLNTMNYVVVVLIVTSAMLAFVVLYNLANINIGERQREIATLKVLGFYDKEVDNYINKENIVFTVFGVILGLGFGVLLTTGIIASIEIDSLRFAQKILLSSYIISAVTTIIFSLIVNFIIHFVLRKIDMIESLKSVE